MNLKTSIASYLIKGLLILAPVLAHGQTIKDEFGVKYSSDGMAKSITGKRDQLFRVINDYPRRK